MTRGMAGDEAAGASQHGAQQATQGADEDADQRANVAASPRKRASRQRLSDEAHLGRALKKATEEEKVHRYIDSAWASLANALCVYDAVAGESADKGM